MILYIDFELLPLKGRITSPCFSKNQYKKLTTFLQKEKPKSAVLNREQEQTCTFKFHASKGINTTSKSEYLNAHHKSNTILWRFQLSFCTLERLS